MRRERPARAARNSRDLLFCPMERELWNGAYGCIGEVQFLLLLFFEDEVRTKLMVIPCIVYSQEDAINTEMKPRENEEETLGYPLIHVDDGVEKKGFGIEAQGRSGWWIKEVRKRTIRMVYIDTPLSSSSSSKRIDSLKYRTGISRRRSLS